MHLICTKLFFQYKVLRWKKIVHSNLTVYLEFDSYPGLNLDLDPEKQKQMRI